MNRVIFFLFAALSAAQADTPANCTYENIAGTWIFHAGPSGQDNTLDCRSGFQVRNSLTVKLSYPDSVMDQDGNKGFWTMIYNQGFEVVVAGRKYFAFSMYEMRNKTVTSYCNRTFDGWSHNLKGEDWACYSGVKQDSVKPSKGSTFGEDIMAIKYRKDLDFINEINRKTKLWEATHYSELEGMTLRERLLRAGGVPKPGGYAYPKRAPVSEKDLDAVRDLPESFDWRSHNGTSFVSPVRDQGSCGSCYAFGSMAMLEARVRLMSNNTMQPVFSTQDIVSCSEYSQGCDGGFPYLIAGKYAEDFGVVEEKCLAYVGKDSVSCDKEQKDCTRYRATNYYYVGGYYGACNEQLMQVELVKNGPIAVSFEVTNDFEAYKKGIYHKVDVGGGFNPWEVTNHVVSIVGYGLENGVKYWTVKNSWGEMWGESGYFRIMRGTDELAIESMAVAATPILPK